VKGVGDNFAETGNKSSSEETGMIKTANNNKYLHILISAALISLLLFSFLPCPPVLAAPVFKPTPASGAVGTAITITGTIFDSYEGDSIHILFDTTEIDNSPIVIPAEGSFSVTYTIPANTTPGIHTFGAKRETTDSSFFISAPFTVEAILMTLNVAQGQTGTDVVLTGSGFYVGQGVTITYQNPGAVNIGTIAASLSGQFSKTFKIPAGTAGIHKFTAANAFGNTAEAVFKVLPGISSDFNSGASGELINVRGSGFGYRSTVNLSLGAHSISSITADDYGNFKTVFAVPAVTRSTYNFRAQDNLGNNAELEFSVIPGAVLSEITGAVGNPLTVTGAGFHPGSTITVYYDDAPVATTTADNNGNFTVTVTIPASSGGGHIIRITDDYVTRQYNFAVETAAPNAPVLLYPDNNDITPACARFQWEPVADTSIPVTYDLEISIYPGFSGTTLRKTGLTVTRYDLTEKEALAATPAGPVYYWRVMATDGAGNRSAWSIIQAFSVDTPKIPVISQPTSGTAVQFPVSLNWAASSSFSQPVTYQVQVSRNIEFSQLLIDEKGITNPGFIIPAEDKRIFNKQIPYYWRVKAVDNARNASTWSDTGSFNIASSGFPAWAVYTLTGLAVVIIALLAYRISRRRHYQSTDNYVIQSGG